MSLRFSTARYLAVTLAVVICSFAGRPAEAQTKSRTRKIEFDTARSSDVMTNQMDLKRDRLRRLEEELSRSFPGLAAPPPMVEDNLTPAFRPPAPTSTQSARTRDILQRRKNWMTIHPEDLLLGTSPTDTLGQMPEDSALQRWATKSSGNLDLNISKPGRSGSDPLNPFEEVESSSKRVKSGSRDRRQGAGDDSNTPAAVREREQSLQRLLGGANDSGGFGMPKRSTFDDFFGLGSRTPTAEEALAHKEYMDRYGKEILAGGTTPGFVNPMAQDNGVQPVQKLPGLDSLGSRSKPFESTPSALSSLMNPGAIADPNTKVVNQWNPLYEAPRPAAPRPVVINSGATAPRRKF